MTDDKEMTPTATCAQRASLFRSWPANTISDVGVEALAKVLVGEYPGGWDADADQDVNAEGEEQLMKCHEDEWPCRRTPVLKTLDLGQVSGNTIKLICTGGCFK